MSESICLISAPVSTDYEEPEDHASRQVQESVRTPKLGVLALAAALEQQGFAARIVDLDVLYSRFLAGRPGHGLEEFAEHAARRIAAAARTSLFGFSTLCSSYPLTLRVASALKRRRPEGAILLGGPQASVVDTATLSAFPAVDFVLRGEADHTLPRFVAEWHGGRRFGDLPGLTYRSPFGPQRNPDAPVVEALDDLPLPAYHLNGGLKGAAYASLELGRGCPFACTFCSTNDYFRRRFRVKSPAVLIAQMRAIARRYGIRTFDLVHDMFTVDRKRVVAFCDAMIESGEGFAWSCSARTDCVDAELLDLMARAGCAGIFFGVETGSARMQRVIDKGLDIGEARRAVETADRLGIETTVAFMTGFPEETEEDFNATAAAYMHALRHAGSSPQLNVLAPLAGTPVYRQHRHEMTLEDLCSDASHQGRSHNAADRALIRAHPEIFPNFYLIPTPGLDRDRVLEFREFLLMASERMRWLLAALHRTAGVLAVFDAWRRWRCAVFGALAGWGMRHYYMQEAARRQFLEFVGTRARDIGDPAVVALLEYHRALSAGDEIPLPACEGPLVGGPIQDGDIPVRRDRIHVLHLRWDIQQVIDGLKQDALFDGGPSPKHYRTEICVGGVRRLVEITPELAAALELCDGTRTVGELSDAMAGWFGRPAVRSLLRFLREEEAIEIHRPVRAPHAARRLPSPVRPVGRGSRSPRAGALSKAGRRP